MAPDTFKVVVLQNGTIGDVTFPTPTEPFRDIDITIAGTNMSNVAVLSADADSGAAPVPSITSTTSSAVKVNLHVRGRNSLVHIDTAIRLADKAGAEACGNDKRYCYKLRDGSSNIHVLAVAPNFVDSTGMDHPSSTTPAKEGQTLTFFVRLMEPAKSSGEKVFWQLAPGSSFALAPGSGTDFNPSAVNSVTVPACQKSQTVKVIFKKAPEGCPTQGCVAEILARIEAQPTFVIGEFGVSPVPLNLPILLRPQPNTPIPPQ